jgi:glucose/arabinose dehydrogenase
MLAIVFSLLRAGQSFVELASASINVLTDIFSDITARCSKGLIFKLTLDDNNDVIDTVVSNVVVKSDISLRSILGMAFDPMDTSPNPSLYVTHSTLFHKKLVSYNGKVSRVNGEKLDAIEHVVTGLPVSDLDHSVNGLEFGDNGELYIQVGGNTNAGVPGDLSSSDLMEDAIFSSAMLVAHLSRLGYGGTVEYNDTGDQISGFDVEIFATGQRNSFDITLHSNDHLYATDNGPNFGFGQTSINCSGTSEKDLSAGDELNLIVKGGYYGQANRKRGESDPRQCRWRSVSEPSDEDYTAPLLVLPSSTNGIIEFQTDHFGGKLRGHLIAGRYKGGLYDITLTSDRESAARGASLLIDQGGIGVTQGPDGTLFVASYDAGEVLFHAPNEPSSLNLEVKSAFPRHGPQMGGSLLSVYGKNLDNVGVTVTVGGQDCPISGSPSASKITCTLPSGSGTVDIVLATDTQVNILAGGYRYISGSE